MRLFGRKPAAVAPPSMELPAGEEVERATKATLLQGKDAISGSLFLTSRRLLFEASKGDARWMSVPFSEITSAGLFPFPRVALGAPASRKQCLAIQTDKEEQVWWDFGERDEREWLPLVKQRLETVPKPENPD